MSFCKVFLLSFTMTACVTWCEPAREDLSAEQVLEKYIEVSTSMTDLGQRDILLSYTGGALRAALEGATDEVITEAFINRKYDLDSFSILSRRDRTPREVEIMFFISYYDTTGIEKGDEPTLTSMKNTVTLFRESKMWNITDVTATKDTEFHFGVTTDSFVSPNAGGTENPDSAEPPVDSE